MLNIKMTDAEPKFKMLQLVKYKYDAIDNYGEKIVLSSIGRIFGIRFWIKLVDGAFVQDFRYDVYEMEKEKPQSMDWIPEDSIKEVVKE